jgi:hypothetical protein
MVEEPAKVESWRNGYNREVTPNLLKRSRTGILRTWKIPIGLLYLGVFLISVAPPAPAAVKGCKKVALTGEVNAGQEWNAPIGQGWVFRILPIQPGNAGYSGWDLVVDRIEPAGFPDALLLATPPYDSLNEREVGTTFGLRAQDAMGWNPRSFRFLTDSSAFLEAQQIYRSRIQGSSKNKAPDPRAMATLLELEKHAANGELRILDARYAPGTGDAAPYAQNWSLAAARMNHEIAPVADGKSTARGALLWMRFSLALWLPAAWKLPAEVHGIPAACAE